jgi:hypothetical protein
VKHIIVLVFVFAIGTNAFAQNPDTRQRARVDKKSEKRERINTLIKLEEEGDVSFRKHSLFGFKLATDGYGISYEIGKYKTLRKTVLYQFELNEKLHNKEEKSRNNSIDFFNSTSYKYGKANNFYQFKVGYGQQHLIGGKANKNGIAVSAIFAGGLSAGLVKPYYVDANDNNDQRIRYKFSDTLPGGSRPQYLGASGFTVGWNELKVKPGVHAKTALRFDYNRFNEAITAVEAGVNAEYYTSKVLQMSTAGTSNIQKSFFFNAYIAVEFGKRK